MSKRGKSARKSKQRSKNKRTVTQSNSIPKTDEITQDLDAIFKTRWHGAVNIRGIRYQILYSVFRAFELYNEKHARSVLRLEGLEDIDLIGLYHQNEYIQVKSADKRWKWSQLKGPLEGFLSVHRNDSNCGFVLAVGFPLTGDIQKLSQRGSLSEEERVKIEKNFHTLCAQVGYSMKESSSLLSKLTITSIPEKIILQELRIVIAERFGLGGEIVETYISVFVAKFLKWAKERKTIDRAELENVRIFVGEALARETEFQAYGRSLIDRILWKKDKSPKDFFDGKGTRSGHIVSGLDITRPVWLEKIDVALNVSKVCILRSSSGQGKSTLLYRYAYEKRSPDNIFILRVAETREQVESICNYLQFRASLGLPILLLIDDVRWQTHFWALVTQQCAALGIRVLVTVRDEDWQRFSQESLTNYEILEPRLDLKEARDIFKLLKSQGKLHPSAISPEWAYEKIDRSHLLMEYISLLTQGQMLKERLKDQVRQIDLQQEDPTKIEILRRTALAHALGTPVFIEKLFQTISFKSDPQQILKSLLGEYLQLENGMLTGLHWVRSNLLAQILHEVFPNPANTALAILEAIPSANISSFVSKALCREGLDNAVFISGLIEKSSRCDIEIILAFLTGIFEAGEYKFFQVNHSLFDEAYESIGTSGSLFLSSGLLPVVQSSLIEELSEQFENFKKLSQIKSKAVQVPRGLDLCREFLIQINSILQSNQFINNISCLGQLLDWYALCEIEISTWNQSYILSILTGNIFQLKIDSFCSFTQGLYRYDETTYRAWFSENQENIISYLMLHIDCIKIDVVENIISIEFFPDGDDPLIVQTTSRLNYLRSAIPFCDRYQSQGILLLP
ncbi:MAG: hypothetical protein J7647_22815 [Cyanobacteria bacterium SBLK]|nr:hypothetical protein [Cyanobacteria bacterium SBLK]